METILKANRIPFTYIDTATNEDARRLYMRRGQGKKFPLLVKEGYFLGGIVEVEEWNEFGELQDEIGEVAEPETSIKTAPVKEGFTAPYPLTLPADAKKAEATASSGASVTSSKKTKDSDETPRVSLEAAQAFGKAGNEAASIAASKKSAASIKSNLSTHTLPDKTIGSLDALSPRPSVDSAMPAPLGLANKSSPTGQPLAGSTEHASHRGSSMSGATDDAIKALEEALAIPEEMEADVATLSTLSIKEDAVASTEDLSTRDVAKDDTASTNEGITKVDSSTASTAVVDDKSSVVAPSTAPTEKEENEAAPSLLVKDNDAREREATPTLAPQDTNTPKVSTDISREKGFDAPAFDNSNHEGDNFKEEQDTEKK
ncbi:Glutaredoxin, partial [Macrophomina phaseolina MS6]